MSASKRATLIGKLNTALKKHYKPLPTQPARPLLEHVLYASLLEDTPADLADEGMAKCEQEFYDWNEVRVTTVTELAQVLSRLPEPVVAARRLKSNLQAIFEEFYTFDLDHLKKENLGKAVNKFEKMPGMTPFVLSYTVQHGLGGHSIPVDYSAMVIMLCTEVASQQEAMSGKVPGLERAIPKSKGIEFSGLLHQAAVALNKNLKDKASRAFIDAVSKGSSSRLDEWLSNKKAARKRVLKRKVEEKAAAKAAAEAAALAAIEAAKNPPKKKKAKDPVRKEVPAAEAAAKETAKAAAKKAAASKAAKKSTPAPVKKAVPAKKKAPAKKTAPSKTAAKKTSKKKPAPVKKPAPAKKKTQKNCSSQESCGLKEGEQEDGTRNESNQEGSNQEGSNQEASNQEASNQEASNQEASTSQEKECQEKDCNQGEASQKSQFEKINEPEIDQA
jgi:endonuclease-3